MNSALRFLAALVMVAAAAPPLGAQDRSSRVVTGTIIDAGTGEPIEGAVVVVEPMPHGVFGPDGASGATRLGRAATTSAAGRYAFPALPAGNYRLRVSRYAYRPARVEIEVGHAAMASLSVGLVVDPVAMEPVEVRLARSDLLDERGGFNLSRRARAATERERQQRFLSSDARIVTAGDVADGVTLAGRDLFRALQRLPGVTTRDDYTAEMWTRGAPWSHTRVTFDGLPLFNPLHGVGVFSGVTEDALGAAFFFPGARPARLGGGAAAVVELASKPAASNGELGGVAELSLVSARALLERGNARGGWLVAGRRSWLDLATWAVEAASGGEDIYIPYSFHDLTLRGDLDLGAGRHLEASALWMSDDVRGDVPDVTEAGPSQWGNALGRVTVETPIAGLAARHTAGAVRFISRGLRDPIGNAGFDELNDLFDPSRIQTDQEIIHWTVSTELTPAVPDAVRRWSAGAGVVGLHQRYRGPTPSAHPSRTTLDSLAIDEDLTHAVLWAERRFTPRASLQLDLGARAELGGRIAGAPAARIAPRLAARWSPPGGRTSVSIAWTRAWQYAQTLSPAGLSIGPRLHPNEIWFLAGDSAPALESDIATLGGEAWLGDEWLASATLWLRRTDGITLPDPTPGPIVDPVPFFPGDGRSHGLDLSLRRLFGRSTASLGYAWTRSETEVLGRTFPAATERRHALDVVATTRIGRAWRVGGAYRWASGAPFTRFFSAVFECPSEAPCRILQPARVEEPNAERGPSWSTLDLLVEWTRERPSWSISVFGQVSNVLNRNNALTYQGTLETGGPVGEDEFERGLPILPVAGVRVAF